MMNVKNAFNVFLVSVLLLVGVYFVIGTTPISFNTPSTNLAVPIYGNYTLILTIDNTNFSNVVNITFYNTTVTWSDPTGEPVTGWTALDSNNTLFNETNSSGNIASFSVTVYTGNFTTGVWGRGDGNYTLTALMANSTNFREYFNVTFLVDNTAPDVTLIYPYMNQTFTNNATVYFAFNITDSMSGNYTYGNTINCSLFVDGTSINDTIVVWNTTDFTPQMTNTSSSVSSFTNASYVMAVPATTIDEGDHLWNMTCYDYNNNVNSTPKFNPNSMHDKSFIGGNFTIVDTQGPSTNAPTFSAASVAKNVAVTITCTGTDIISPNPIEYVSVKAPNGAWQEDLGISPYSFTGTNTAGTWTARCRSRDSSGNTGGYGSEATFTVTVASSSSGESSGGSGGSSSSSVSVTALAGQTQNLGNLADSANGEGIINAYQSSTVMFSVVSSSAADLGSHSIFFGSVDYINGEITVTISSDPVTLTMSVGDVETVDLDSDEVGDVEITLNDIDSYGRASLVIKDLKVAPVGETSGGETSGGETSGTALENGGGLGIIWWILIIIVVVVIIVLIIPKKKRK